MTESTSILTATDIHREFTTATGAVTVLTGVNLELHRGSMVAVTGASGVGKSTLLHVLGGLDRPSKGEVSISGEKLGNKSETALARFRNKRVGFVFQHHYLLDDFTALENVMMPQLIAGRTRQQAGEQAERLLGMVGLTDRTSHRPRQLSGGEQQRVAVARSLANDPEIVLADEPSGNLDIHTGRALHDLLRQLNAEKGISFLIATHNLELARECGRWLQIKDGKVTEHDSGQG